MKAALSGKDLIEAIDEKIIENSVPMKALSIVISGLRDNPLRTIYDCETAPSAWTKRHDRYPGKSIVDKLSVLDNLLNCQY